MEFLPLLGFADLNHRCFFTFGTIITYTPVKPLWVSKENKPKVGHILAIMCYVNIHYLNCHSFES